ncbi:MAG: UMP kinase [Candidatus Hadarchaeales archaeon]
MRITLCLGGSVLVPDEPDAECYSKVVAVIKKLREKHEVLVVTGGGRTARRYIEVAKELGLSEIECHQVGIWATRLNALLLSLALGSKEVQTELGKAALLPLSGGVPVMGGTTPGQTTDAVAAMLAQMSRSDLLIFFSDVDGVYTADPKRDPSAKKIDRIRAEDLVKLVDVAVQPGMRIIIDPIAARIVLGSKIKTLFLGRKELERLPEIVEGAPHTGTEVVF